jgi:hypothetical protein
LNVPWEPSNPIQVEVLASMPSLVTLLIKQASLMTSSAPRAPTKTKQVKQTARILALVFMPLALPKLNLSLALPEPSSLPSQRILAT